MPKYVFPPCVTPVGDYYNIPGVGRLPRVTQVIKAFGGPRVDKLMGYAAAKGTNYRKHTQDLADIGTAIHDRIHWDMRAELGLPQPGPIPVLTEHSSIGYSAYRRWWQGAHLTPVAAEQTLWSKKLKAAGSVDLLAEHEADGLGIVDYKPSNIYESYHLQMIFYVLAAQEMGYPVRWASFVPLPRTWAQAHDPVVPIPMGTYTWRMNRPHLWTMTWEELKECAHATRTLYKGFMEEREIDNDWRSDARRDQRDPQTEGTGTH